MTIMTLGQVAAKQDWKCWSESCDQGLTPITNTVPALSVEGKDVILCLTCAEEALQCYRPIGHPGLAALFNVTRQYRPRLLTLLEIGKRYCALGKVTRCDWMELCPGPNEAAKSRALDRVKGWARTLWPKFAYKKVKKEWVFIIGEPLLFVDFIERLLDSLAVLDDEDTPDASPWAFFRRAAS